MKSLDVKTAFTSNDIVLASTDCTQKAVSRQIAVVGIPLYTFHRCTFLPCSGNCMVTCKLTDAFHFHNMQGSVSSVESDASTNGGPASGLPNLPFHDRMQITTARTVAADKSEPYYTLSLKSY